MLKKLATEYKRDASKPDSHLQPQHQADSEHGENQKVSALKGGRSLNNNDVISQATSHTKPSTDTPQNKKVTIFKMATKSSINLIQEPKSDELTH
jgi:hypothetical protein